MMKKSSKNSGARSGCEIEFNICGGNFDQCKFNVIRLDYREENNLNKRTYQKKKHQQSSKSISSSQNKDNKEESEYECKSHISSTVNKIRHNETDSTTSSANHSISPPQPLRSKLSVVSYPFRGSSLSFDEKEGLKHKSSDNSTCSKENFHEEAQETVRECYSRNSLNKKTKEANNETAVRQDCVHTCKVERDKHLDICKDTKTVSSKCTTTAEECCSRCSNSSTIISPDEFPMPRGPLAIHIDFEECHSRCSSAISIVDQVYYKSGDNEDTNVERTESAYEFDYAEGASDIQNIKVQTWLKHQHGKDGYYCKSISHSEDSGESDTSSFDEDDNIDKDQRRDCSVSFNIHNGSLRNCQFNLISLKAIEQQNIIEQIENISGSLNSHPSTSSSKYKSGYSNFEYKNSSRCSEIETTTDNQERSECSFPITHAKEKEYKHPERHVCVFESDDCIQSGKKNKNETFKARPQEDLSRTCRYEQETHLRKYEEKALHVLGVSDAQIENVQERLKQREDESVSNSSRHSQSSDEAIHVPTGVSDAQIENVQDRLNHPEDESVSYSSRHSQTSDDAIHVPTGVSDVRNEKVHDRWNRQEGEPISDSRMHSQTSVEAMHAPTASGWSRRPMKKKAVNMSIDKDEYPGRISKSDSQRQVRKDYTAEAEGINGDEQIHLSEPWLPIQRTSRHRVRPSVVTSSEQRQTQTMAGYSSEGATGGTDCVRPCLVDSSEQRQTQMIAGFSSEGAIGGTDCVKPKRPGNLNKEKTKVKPEKDSQGASGEHDSDSQKGQTHTNSGLASLGATGGHDIACLVKKKTSHYNKSEAGYNTQGATGGPDTEKRYQKSKPQKGKTNVEAALNSELATDGHHTEFGETSECRICWERPKNTALIPCGHVVCCYACSLKLSYCPICRKKIEQSVKLYIS